MYGNLLMDILRHSFDTTKCVKRTWKSLFPSTVLIEGWPIFRSYGRDFLVKYGMLGSSNDLLFIFIATNLGKQKHFDRSPYAFLTCDEPSFIPSESSNYFCMRNKNKKT